MILLTMEGFLLALVCLSPWCYGAVHPGFELLLDAGIASLLLLWAVRGLLQGRFSWRKCPVALCLAALFVIAVVQLVPWPNSWLSRLSPGTAELYDRLHPAQGEVIPSPDGEVFTSFGANRTISLCPGVTQREAIRLLAVLLLFVVVRNNLASTAHLRRLSIVVFVNGLLLSLFALVQFFIYGPRLLYGVYPTAGSAFGPFICRNHFPYYVNMCLGLGIGLFLSYLGNASRSRRRSGSEFSSSTVSGESEGLGLLSTLGRLLQRPRALWLGFALVILTASIVFSSSRGGTLALLGGAVVCVLVHLRRSASSLRLGVGALLVGLVATAFLAWFGLDRVTERWEQLFDAAEAKENKVDRLALWSANLPGFKEFPLWGTGYGTFEFTELLRRDDPRQEGVLAVHAHNDYLEALLEGGIVGLLPLLLLVGLLFWFGYRAVRRQQRSSAGWLATGLFFGLVTLLIHSVVDFGLHVPAIAFLATVLLAHLAALGSRSRRSGRRETSPPSQGEEHRDEASSLRWGGLAPTVAALVMGVFALVLVQQGWKAHKAERLRDTAVRLGEGVDHPDRQLQIAYLQAAVQETPKAPYVRLELARTQMALYREQEQKEKSRGTALSLMHGMSGLVGGVSGPAGLSPAVVCASSFSFQEEMSRREERRQLNPLLLATLSSYLRARDICPIVTEPHVRIAASADKMIRGDSTEAYLERAKFLSPANTTIWYLCGKQEFQSDRCDEAWRSWRRSLELSDQHLPPIMDQARQVLSGGDVLGKVLPDKPKVLFLAAMYLYPTEEALADRRPFLEKALSVVTEQVGPPEAEDLHVKGLIHESLGQKKEALTAYQTALGHAPKDKMIDWRMSYARLLYEEGQLREASRQLLTVLTQQPGRADAKEMLETIRRELARKL
ncbi:MAG TPA: O-antigen ligase family protein [Gemmataceae bacterium]